jgi:hypothetical protein
MGGNAARATLMRGHAILLWGEVGKQGQDALATNSIPISISISISIPKPTPIPVSGWSVSLSVSSSQSSSATRACGWSIRKPIPIPVPRSSWSGSLSGSLSPSSSHSFTGCFIGLHKPLLFCQKRGGGGTQVCTATSCVGGP